MPERLIRFWISGAFDCCGDRIQCNSHIPSVRRSRRTEWLAPCGGGTDCIEEHLRIVCGDCRRKAEGILQEVREAVLKSCSDIWYGEELLFIPSYQYSRIRGCDFGSEKRLTLGEGSSTQLKGGIYADLCLENNFYSQIEPARFLQAELEQRLKFSLDSPYLLVQHRRRDTPQGSLDSVAIGSILANFATPLPIVLLSFSTGRALDSYSELSGFNNLHHLKISSFLEQSCLISRATHCIFFSEGDYGSHAYVPPFIGKDVSVVCPWGVYQNGTTPISFWNREVFRFGGQIYSFVAEDICRNSSSMSKFSEDIIAKYFDHIFSGRDAGHYVANGSQPR